jgi:hypothetical protein
LSALQLCAAGQSHWTKISVIPSGVSEANEVEGSVFGPPPRDEALTKKRSLGFAALRSGRRNQAICDCRALRGQQEIAIRMGKHPASPVTIRSPIVPSHS